MNDRGAPRVIAVDIDDTLNDFSETLRRTDFPFDPRYGLGEPVFRRYLEQIRQNVPDPSDRLSTGYSFFRIQIHCEVYRLATARPDGVRFMRWLREGRWRIVICTRRDLRRAGDLTKAWLQAQGIPFDHLFSAMNKIAFCRAWEIPILVDDDPRSIAYGPRHGVRVFHPVPPAREYDAVDGFRTFDEVRAWIAA